MFRVEFIRFVTGQREAEVLLTLTGDFNTLDAAIEHGTVQLKTKLDAAGFQVVEIESGTERLVAQRLRALH
jgi:hypothetical protein